MISNLSIIWYFCISNIFEDDTPPIFIYDSSGLLKSDNFPLATIIKFPNLEHGEKIDHFLRIHCKSKYCLLIDDDAFLLNKNALIHGLNWLMQDNKNAFYSYKPRDWWKFNINGEQFCPMGSYALLFKPEIISNHNLSFKTVPTKNKLIREGSGYYDTADFIQETLIKLGFFINIGEEKIQSMIPTFYGTSSGFLSFYKKKFFSKKYKRDSIKNINKLLKIDFNNLLRGYSVATTIEIYEKLFKCEATYADFLSRDYFIKHLDDFIMPSQIEYVKNRLLKMDEIYNSLINK
jgi:hypothetical protein